MMLAILGYAKKVNNMTNNIIDVVAIQLEKLQYIIQL